MNERFDVLVVGAGRRGLPLPWLLPKPARMWLRSTTIRLPEDRSGAMTAPCRRRRVLRFFRRGYPACPLKLRNRRGRGEPSSCSRIFK